MGVCYRRQIMCMASANWLLVSLIGAGILPAQAADSTAVQKKGISVQSYRAWEECLTMQASGVQAIVAPAVGGRIGQYSVGGENIIFENPSSFGKTLGNTSTNFSVGGYQCDIGPELRGIPNHDALWMGLYHWQTPKDFTTKVSSEHDLNVGVQMEKEIIIEPGTGDLGITQTMRNISDKDLAYCLWDRTLCKNDGFAFFALNRKSRFKAGWSIRRTIDGKFVYDGATPASPKVKIMKGVLVA